MKKFDLVWNWNKFIASGYFDDLPRVKAFMSENVQAGQKDNELFIYAKNTAQSEWISSHILRKAQEDFSEYCNETVLLTIQIRKQENTYSVEKHHKQKSQSKWKWGIGLCLIVLIIAGILFVVLDIPVLTLPPFVEALLYTAGAIIGAGIVIVMIEIFFLDVLDSSIFLFLSKKGWEEKPLSCIAGVIVLLLALVFILSVFLGVLLDGPVQMPIDYDYIRSDEPYRTWP